MSGETRSVFIIINEWAPEGSLNSSSEIVGNRFFWNEDDAWEHLFLIAESYDVDLDLDHNSFFLPSVTGIDEQCFFIDELNWSE